MRSLALTRLVLAQLGVELVRHAHNVHALLAGGEVEPRLTRKRARVAALLAAAGAQAEPTRARPRRKHHAGEQIPPRLRSTARRGAPPAARSPARSRRLAADDDLAGHRDAHARCRVGDCRADCARERIGIGGRAIELAASRRAPRRAMSSVTARTQRDRPGAARRARADLAIAVGRESISPSRALPRATIPSSRIRARWASTPRATHRHRAARERLIIRLQCHHGAGSAANAPSVRTPSASSMCCTSGAIAEQRQRLRREERRRAAARHRRDRAIAVRRRDPRGEAIVGDADAPRCRATRAARSRARRTRDRALRAGTSGVQRVVRARRRARRARRAVRSRAARRLPRTRRRVPSRRRARRLLRRARAPPPRSCARTPIACGRTRAGRDHRAARSARA